MSIIRKSSKRKSSSLSNQMLLEELNQDKLENLSANSENIPSSKHQNFTSIFNVPIQKVMKKKKNNLKIILNNLFIIIP